MTLSSYRSLIWKRLGAASLALGLAFSGSAPALAATDINLVLNWKYEGAQAWFFLAEDKGYFKEQGLNVTIDQGEGSAASVPKVASGVYHAGFGDTNALIQLASTQPERAPVGVYMIYNTPPFVIAVKADSPIREPKDVEGKVIGAPANDAALKLFPAFAELTGIDQSKVTINNMAPNLREQLLMRGQIDAAFGYLTTISFSAKGMRVDPEKELRFIRYGDHGMDLYSNSIFFSQDFINNHPDAVRGFLTAVNQAIQDAIAHPEEAIDALMKREPLLNRSVEMDKMLSTVRNDMSHPEIADIGLGDVNDERLKKNIDIVVAANELDNTPGIEQIFDRRFLPERDARPSEL
ncbi:ABC transporter substrate-binding protein [Pseudomonas sediminis]|uniref:ABC transporter substrate-binding protein n=1 Tax=Pseudomonas sediminis TaxID=1691904 RepID=UPI0024490B6E|nr:ABC transporter substrate-binding protein [Pseudomonas sediminis]MDG9757656.1 ABC transporter substrate-binding protein [Pseudomonas sediminis]